MNRKISILALCIVMAFSFSACISLQPLKIPDMSKMAVYQTENFQVKFSEANGGGLAVSHKNNPERVLWSTLPGKSFIETAIGQESFHEARGSFFIDDTIKTQLTRQTITAVQSENGAVIVSGQLSDASEKTSTGYQLVFTEKSKNQLGFDLSFTDDRFNRTYLTYASDKDEHFFGFGEQYTFFDLKGKRLPLFVMEQGIGRGAQPITFLANLTADSGGDWHTSYAGVPHYISSRQNSLFLENYEYSVFDMRKDDRVRIEALSGKMTGRILYGETPAELIEEYTQFAGRMRKLPDWILEGAILGIQGGTASVKKIYDRFKELGLPTAALWLQDWVGARVTSFGKQLWWNWTLDEDRYPKRKESIESLEKDGVKVLAYVNPFLADISERETQSKRNLFAEAKENNYLVMDHAGQPYMIPNTSFSAALVDLSNPEARTWMKKVIKEEMIDIGVMGWMADFGEALPMDTEIFSKESTATYHNKYAEEWARLNREVLDETENGDEIVFFSRSGYRQSPKYSTLFWLGDQLVTWDKYDGIKTAVVGLLSSGLSGYSFNHSDIGGYTTISSAIVDYHRSPELNRRWMELSSFNVIYRSHEGNIPSVNDQVYSNPESEAHFVRCAKIYKAWEAYRKQLVAQAAETGLPVIRHPFIHYPNDPKVYSLLYQFMVGEDFMVAPVLDPGKETVSLYLPEGQWVHTWSGKVFEAGNDGLEITLPAPMGKPCMLYKQGSIHGENFMANLKKMNIN